MLNKISDSDSDSDSNFSRYNLIKIYTKTHQTTPYFQNVLV